jgi:hypothetical protein
MEFTPHGFCLAWDPPLLWLTLLGHAMTAFAYFGIPFMLLAAVRRIFAVPAWLLGLFAAFIFLCGLSHVLEIVVLFIPVYWALTIEVMATAGVSLTTLYFLPLAIVQIRDLQNRPAVQKGAGDAIPR